MVRFYLDPCLLFMFGGLRYIADQVEACEAVAGYTEAEACLRGVIATTAEFVLALRDCYLA
jgi:hypothetical protein